MISPRGEPDKRFLSELERQRIQQKHSQRRKELTINVKPTVEEKEKKRKGRTTSALVDDSAELSAVTIPQNALGVSHYYSPLSSEVFASHHQLEAIAREAHSVVALPEFVVIGQRGHGKSTIVEIMTGFPLAHVGLQKEGATRRPVHYRFTNNKAVAPQQVRTRIKYDPITRDRNIVVDVCDLPSEIRKRCSGEDGVVLLESPLYVEVEACNTLNYVVIDTPGLLFDGSEEDKRILHAVSSLASHTHNRFIIAVEEANTNWKNLHMPCLSKQLDPSLSRTTLVFTKFHTILKTMTNEEDINGYLRGGKNSAVKCFWVSGPSQVSRGDVVSAGEGYGEEEEGKEWQDLVQRVHWRDVGLLESLHYKRKYRNNIGGLLLRRYIHKIMWRTYVDAIPQVHHHLIQQLTAQRKEVSSLEKEQSLVSVGKARAIANRYIDSLVGVFTRMIAGSSESTPHLTGFTRAEEIAASGFIQWTNANGQVLQHSSHKVPFEEVRLCGGQQFDRLLAELRGVASNMELREEELYQYGCVRGSDEVSTTGSSTHHTHSGTPDLLWGACELAHTHAKNTLIPVIHVAILRAIHISHSLLNIASQELHKNMERKEGGLYIDRMEHYPFFITFVKEEFLRFVDQLATECKDKCMDEFHSTETIYWGYTERIAVSSGVEEGTSSLYEHSLIEAAQCVFNYTKERITKNVLLKLYNIFIFKLHDGVEHQLLEKISRLSDNEISDMFQLETITNKIENKIDVVSNKQEQLELLFEVFNKCSTSFTVELTRELNIL